MKILDVRTRKLEEGKVEAVALTDREDADGSPVVLRGYGATPDEAIADVRRKAEGAGA
jgi:hypothetical protein